MDLRSQTVFSQLIDFLPRYEFNKCVERYEGNHKVHDFSCWKQFLCMAFAQLTYRESLRDIETCLRVMSDKLYHMGIQGIARNTLANANKVRDWRIYADFAQSLIVEARRLYAQEAFGVELDQTAYALDSSTIDLCLSLFPWAAFRKRKGAVKLHTLLDLRGNIPSLIIITNGKIHAVNILDELTLEAGAIYIVDRGYVDFERFYTIHQASAFSVTRAKDNCDSRRVYSRPVDKFLSATTSFSELSARTSFSVFLVAWSCRAKRRRFLLASTPPRDSAVRLIRRCAGMGSMLLPIPLAHIG